jgi:hypothetical protein
MSERERTLRTYIAGKLDAYAFKHMPITLISVAALSRTEAQHFVVGARYGGPRLTRMSYTQGLQRFSEAAYRCHAMHANTMSGAGDIVSMQDHRNGSGRALFRGRGGDRAGGADRRHSTQISRSIFFKKPAGTLRAGDTGRSGLSGLKIPPTFETLNLETLNLETRRTQRKKSPQRSIGWNKECGLCGLPGFALSVFSVFQG